MDRDETLLLRAREMRKGPARGEKEFWGKLRDRRLHNFKFRRQVSPGDYIVDFVCFEVRLIVEIDGDSHKGKEAYDQRRKQWLDSEGFQVLRFGSEIVQWSSAEMLGEVMVACHSRMSE